ncbi:lamin tail domain-containing protein [Nocardioides sambongensis]|uniref:lamin tail domain-containing protein n=1 Tax=Nocardioides sambongensis TaxID=2589074 RepID=UPI0015E835C4|nr:lamin tail domain-containing protein [Nocardioides sambongensis]
MQINPVQAGPAPIDSSQSRRRALAAAVAGTVVLAPLALVLAPLPASAAATDIRINEIITDSATVADSIELTNIGAASVDLSGWVVKDDKDDRTLALPSGTELAPGDYLTVVTATDDDAGFGLGNGDAARIFLPDGTTLVDGHSFPSHSAPSWSRCEDGTGDFVQANSETLGAPNDCPAPGGAADVRINEIESNGDVVGDWVELVNAGDAAADISGWRLIDADPEHQFAVVPDGTVLAPGGFVALYTEFPAPGFGLGSADTVTLYRADGTSEVDTHSWADGHAGTTLGRCPDGTGSWQETTVPTRGSANACSPVRINEVESSDPAGGPDWVELVNLSGADVDLAGWEIRDSGDAEPTVLPAGTVVPAGGHLVVDDLAAGLGGSDSARLLDDTGAVIDSHSWVAHAPTTYGRCSDGVGTFTGTVAATPGGVNDCPGLDTAPWPGSPEVATSDLAETFGQDASGVTFDPEHAGVLWVAQNKAGTLRKLTKDGDTWVPAAGWAEGRDPRYADGTGAPDTEGITIGPDSAVYLASERNNDVSGVSRNTVLRYEPEVSMNATDEWDLTAVLPAVGANLGLEGVTWVPDRYLVESGFVDDSTGSAYDPATYTDHGSGLYVVAVEGTGQLYVLALDQTDAVDEAAHLVATVDPRLLTNAGPAAAMDVSWDPETEQIWALCDDSCDGVSVTLTVDEAGSFAVDAAYDRPVGMPNLNNEGLAVAPQSTCVDGRKEVVWSDDGDTDGHALRSGTLPCTATEPEPESEAKRFALKRKPRIVGAHRVGRTMRVRTGAVAPRPTAVRVEWRVAGKVVRGNARTLKARTWMAGKPVVVRVTYRAPGYQPRTVRSAPVRIRR